MHDSNPYTAPSFSNRLIQGEHHVARLNFWSVYAIAVLATLVTAAPILWGASYWQLIDWTIILPAMGLAFLLQAVIIRWQSVLLSSDLLRCADFWGRTHTVQVASIQAVERVGLPPFRFLKLHHEEDSPPLWLPLFLQQPDAFWDYVVRELPPTHPLVEYGQPWLNARSLSQD